MYSLRDADENLHKGEKGRVIVVCIWDYNMKSLSNRIITGLFELNVALNF